jgi:hypothetical protein
MSPDAGSISSLQRAFPVDKQAATARGRRQRKVVAPPAEAAEYIGEAQLCAWLRKDPRTVGRWRDNGTGPPFIRNGLRHILYRVSDVQRWLTDRTYQHTAEEVTRRQPR